MLELSVESEEWNLVDDEVQCVNRDNVRSLDHSPPSKTSFIRRVQDTREGESIHPAVTKVNVVTQGFCYLRPMGDPVFVV